MVSLCIGVLSFLLGFLLGYLLAFFQWRKDARQWTQQKSRMARMLLEANKRAAPEDPPKPRQTQKQPRKAPISPAPTRKPAASPGATDLRPDVRAGFQAVESLRLEFQYLLPDTLILQPGNGYARNAQNALIPEADTFQGMNTAAGYAMAGLFYLYNVGYHGREYTFQQILNGEMGGGYVRVQSVIKAAKIDPVSGTGYYCLAQKGLLDVVDVR